MEGRLHAHQWEGNDGQTRFRNEIIASRVMFLDRPGAADSGAEDLVSEPAFGSAGDPLSADPLSTDDLPL